MTGEAFEGVGLCSKSARQTKSKLMAEDQVINFGILLFFFID